MATLSPSLRQLAREVAPGFPRAGSSDGWIADENHPPGSDHQPDSNGLVHAIDIDIDGINFSPGQVLLTVLRDPRTKYVIFQGKLYYPDGTVKPNQGHFGHIHISGKYGATYENDTRVWFQSDPQPQEEDVPEITRKLFRIDGGDKVYMTHMKADLRLGKVHIASQDAFKALGFDPSWLSPGNQNIDNVLGSSYLARLPDFGSVG